MASHLVMETFQSIRSNLVALKSMRITKKVQQKEGGNRQLLVTVAAVACAVLPFDIFQMLVLLLGAVAYAVLWGPWPQSSQRKPSRPQKVAAGPAQACSGPSLSMKPRAGCSELDAPKSVAAFSCRKTASKTMVSQQRGMDAGCAPRTMLVKAKQFQPSLEKTNATPASLPVQQKVEIRSQSVMPVAAPTLASSEWEGQVDEFLQHILPTSEGNKAIQELTQHVQRLLQQVLPEADVFGYACSSFTGRQAFAVAVPEVDIVVNASPAALERLLRPQKRTQPQEAKDAFKLHKAAVRTCVSHLVSTGRFKFRRSAFKNDEPKVTLLAPDSFAAKYGLLEEGVPIDFSVNAVMPLCNAALVTECKQLQPASRDLILLVKRWAKHRGICHVAKGHLPPYAWSILCIYFLQVGAGDKQAPLFPDLEALCSARSMNSLLKEVHSKQEAAVEEAHANSTFMEHSGTPCKLLQDFFAFYQAFHWQTQTVAIRRSSTLRRRSSTAPVAGNKQLACIRDPFNGDRNVAACLGEASFGRLKEELCRAHVVCSSGKPSLTELLEPWAPPVAREAAALSDKEDC